LTGDDLFGGMRLNNDEITGYVADIMAKQVKSPVYWQETVENMARDGIDTLIEIGPGTTLCGIVKKIAPGVTTLNIENTESLKKTMGVLAEMAGVKGDNGNA
jgi:[acyl-carrier-protein] S-malonyltransferase